MQVTSDTLFHFTTSLNNLKNILSKKFQLTYCKEKYQLDYETYESYYPMISFCDIPLSLAKDQIKRYGSYAIGMTKEWGIKHNLNPIVYIEKDSLLAKDIIATIENLGKTNSPVLAILEKVRTLIAETSKSVVDLTANAKVLKSEKKPFLTIELQRLKEKVESMIIIPDYIELSKSLVRTANHSFNLFRYIKNYEGTLNRNSKIFSNYRFYDEREWRYVPALIDNRVKISLNAEQFKEYRGLSKSKPFIENIKLPFNSNDIKYLIVKSSKDIPKLIKTIKSTDNLTKNTNDGDILTTKILTVEQLNKDF